MSQAIGKHDNIPTVSAPAYINNRTVTTAESETVPAGATRVVISSDAAIWVCFSTTAAVPSTDVTNGSGSLPIAAGAPRAFWISPASTISVISAAGTAHVAFEYSFGWVNGFFT